VKADEIARPQKKETFTMKKLILFALVASAAFGFVRTASAQARQISGKIPFSFTAGSARLAGGEYRITYEMSGLVTFHNLDTGGSAVTFVGADDGSKDGSCKLIFSRYGDQYFLKQSQCKAAHANFFIPTSGLERTALERAAVSRDAEQTFVAMR
jgi:hypothetical protein